MELNESTLTLSRFSTNQLLALQSLQDHQERNSSLPFVLVGCKNSIVDTWFKIGLVVRTKCMQFIAKTHIFQNSEIGRISKLN
jgi:hypothetical protein